MTCSRFAAATFSFAAFSTGILLPAQGSPNINLIRILQPPDTRLTAGPVTLTGTATSGLMVIYVSNSPAVCTVSGSKVTLNSAGVCSITANQAGDGTFPAADPAVFTFNVLPGAQSINFTQLPNPALTPGTAPLIATATSGLPVSFASNSLTICTVSGVTVTLLTVGVCSITAAQPGNMNYAATAETRTFNVVPAGIVPVSNFPADALQIRYASNLTQGDSVIEITNAAANGNSCLGPCFGPQPGNICVNVYAFSPDEQLVSCCSCLITPNGLVSLSVNQDLLSNTLTGVRPNSVVVKLVNTGATANFTGTSCTNSAALAGSAAFPVAGGMLAFGTTVHPMTGAAAFATTETPFLQSTLSTAELASITNRCANIIGNGSMFGICPSCGK